MSIIHTNTHQKTDPPTPKKPLWRRPPLHPYLHQLTPVLPIPYFLKNHKITPHPPKTEAENPQKQGEEDHSTLQQDETIPSSSTAQPTETEAENLQKLVKEGAITQEQAEFILPSSTAKTCERELENSKKQGEEDHSTLQQDETIPSSSTAQPTETEAENLQKLVKEGTITQEQAEFILPSSTAKTSERELENPQKQGEEDHATLQQEETIPSSSTAQPTETEAENLQKLVKEGTITQEQAEFILSSSTEQTSEMEPKNSQKQGEEDHATLQQEETRLSSSRVQPTETEAENLQKLVKEGAITQEQAEFILSSSSNSKAPEEPKNPPKPSMEDRISQLAKELGLTKEEAAFILNGPSVVEEEREKMKQLPAGAPLGINTKSSNHCYIVALLQCLANSTGRAYPYKMDSVASAVSTYCEKRNARKASQDATIDIDSKGIETALIRADQEQITIALQREAILNQFLEETKRAFRSPAFASGEQSDAIAALRYFLQDDSYTYMVELSSLHQDSQFDTDILLIQSINETGAPLKISPKNGNYSLAGVIVHTGHLNENLSAESGHYVAYLHTEKGFFHCNGSIVQAVTQADFIRATEGTSLLFYTKNPKTPTVPSATQKSLPTIDRAKSISEILASFNKEKKELQSIVTLATEYNELFSKNEREKLSSIREYLEITSPNTLDRKPYSSASLTNPRLTDEETQWIDQAITVFLNREGLRSIFEAHCQKNKIPPRDAASMLQSIKEFVFRRIQNRAKQIRDI